ncbi:helix-turn-helix domain-containing protein [Actinokineospora inagensis]|uniref:helix-turn-helix domain-containing protein n=1 Tax=Actinokineospora inagensis TaxID=103730 RepID=UPI001FE221CC|nr:helix-turn-helix transcriptional regulator [Actinokineospora inagensis]
MVADEDSVGRRIAAHRKLFGLTQADLADRAGYSLSYVRAIEQGREVVPNGFVATVARALKVEPEVLTGAPYRDTVLAEGSLGEVAELRSIVAEGHYVRPLPPGSIQELARELDKVIRMYRNDSGQRALAKLPGLIRKLHGAARETSSDGERGRIFSLLSAAYVTAERLFRRFGYLTHCAPTLDQLEWTAAQADDPLYRAQAKAKRARVLMYFGATEVSASLVEAATAEAHGDSEAAIAVTGYAHLCGAIAAARGRDIGRAHDRIREAEKLAVRIDGESELYGTLFGVGNVGIHRVAVEMEAGDPEKAARDGFALRLPAGIAPPRAGHHWQDVARACLLAGDPTRSLVALNRARKVAPQQTRLHPAVRETLRGIAEAERRKSDSLASFAGWVGIRL